MRPYVDEELCTACGTCEEVCPADPNVFTIEDVAKVVHPDACIECRQCEESCPVEAIKVRE